MSYLAQVLMVFLALAIWAVALIVSLTGFALLALQGITAAESICVVLIVSAIAIGLVYGGWRLVAWAKSMSRC